MWTFISTSSLQTKSANQCFLNRFYTRRRCGKAGVARAILERQTFLGISWEVRGSGELIAEDCCGGYDPGNMKVATLLLLAALVAAACAQAPTSQGPSSKEVEAVYSDAHALYVDLHQNPELSSHETQTAAKLASRLRGLGYDVTEHVGGTGIVALMKNGAGPTVMLRTELDALPVEEKTGLTYASKVKTKDDAGHEVAVMHACGHDLHMA